jgi:hypothetical protein
MYVRRKAVSMSKTLAAKCGPKLGFSEEFLLEGIRRDLTGSAFQCEGHRKAWAQFGFGVGGILSS